MGQSEREEGEEEVTKGMSGVKLRLRDWEQVGYYCVHLIDRAQSKLHTAQSVMWSRLFCLLQPLAGFSLQYFARSNRTWTLYVQTEHGHQGIPVPPQSRVSTIHFCVWIQLGGNFLLEVL